jgi:hypothetical protein
MLNEMVDRVGGKAVALALAAGLAVILLGGGIAAGFALAKGMAAAPTPTASPPPPTSTPVPTPTPVIITREAIIRQVQQVSRLETTIYVVERVIEIKQSDAFWPDWLRGDRILLIAYGRVTAGVDLAKLQPQDVVVDNDKRMVTITLPAVEVLSYALDNSKTRVYDRQRGLLAPSNAQLESQARQMAEREILRAAYEDGILERADGDARRAVEDFLRLTGYQVTVRSSPLPAIPEDLRPAGK